MTIILYEIPSNNPDVPWSLNTWKIKSCLNYKSLPYQTEWVECPDIEPHYKRFGIPSTGKKLRTGGKDDLYTLPAIYDSSTDTYLLDSIPIAEYLENTPHNTLPIFPKGMKCLQMAFQQSFIPCLAPLWQFVGVMAVVKFNPPSANYFRRAREASHPGISVGEMCPTDKKTKEEWVKIEKSLGKTSRYDKSDQSGPFIMGNIISWPISLWGVL